jgi:hypothetical protein
MSQLRLTKEEKQFKKNMSIPGPALYRFSGRLPLRSIRSTLNKKDPAWKYRSQVMVPDNLVGSSFIMSD